MSQLYRFSGTLPEIGSTIEFDNATVFISYPTPQTWQADFVLEPGITQYKYRFLSGSQYSSWKTFEKEVSYGEQAAQPASNTLDEFGLLLDTKRIREERNEDYKARLLDVFVHRGNPKIAGLINAICRDLDIDYNDQALLVAREQDPSTGQEWVGVLFEVTDRYVCLSSHTFVKTRQAKYIDPVELTVVPDDYVVSDLLIETEGGTELEDFRLDHVNNVIYTFDPAMADQRVLLSYRYEERVDRLEQTVQQVADALDAITTPAGYTVVSTTVASGYGSESAEGLSPLPQTVLANRHLDASGTEVTGSLPVRWSDLALHQIWDPEYQNKYRSWTGSLHNTRFSSYAHALRRLARSTWGSLVADDSVWGSKDFPIEGGQHLDTTYDAALGYWVDHVTGAVYDRWQNTVAGLDYAGILVSDLRSGVGGIEDLNVSIGKSGPIVGTVGEASHTVSKESSDQTVPIGSSPVEGGVELP